MQLILADTPHTVEDFVDFMELAMGVQNTWLDAAERKPDSSGITGKFLLVRRCLLYTSDAADE